MKKEKAKDRNEKRLSRSGQALVEFALVFPLFLLLLIGIFDLGRLLYTKHMMDLATREGARAGAVAIEPEEAVQIASELSQKFLIDHQLDNLASVNAEIQTVEGVDAVAVSITYSFKPTVSVGPFSLFKNNTLISSTFSRKEG